jgi:hypothetical protein
MKAWCNQKIGSAGDAKVSCMTAPIPLWPQACAPPSAQLAMEEYEPWALHPFTMFEFVLAVSESSLLRARQ